MVPEARLTASSSAASVPAASPEASCHEPAGAATFSFEWPLTGAGSAAAFCSPTIDQPGPWDAGRAGSTGRDGSDGRSAGRGGSVLAGSYGATRSSGAGPGVHSSCGGWYGSGSAGGVQAGAAGAAGGAGAGVGGAPSSHIEDPPSSAGRAGAAGAGGGG